MAYESKITDSDARQLGIPEGTDGVDLIDLMDLSRPAWVQRGVDSALVDNEDELIAIGALEDTGYSCLARYATPHAPMA